jgi:hypothetical protein
MNGNIAAAYFEPTAIRANEAILVVPAPRVCMTDPAKSSSMRLMSLENLGDGQSGKNHDVHPP